MRERFKASVLCMPCLSGATLIHACITEVAGADRPDVDEGLALSEELSESIATTPVPLTDKQRAELDRRLAEHEPNRDNVVPWGGAKFSLDRRLKGR
jgi:putative addiction module component (TIGR02574 family)